jgi:hypothetical protein
MKTSFVWDIMLCSLVTANRRFGGTHRFHHQVREAKEETGIKQRASRALLKMEAIRFSETSVGFHRTTRHYIPEDTTLQNIS